MYGTESDVLFLPRLNRPLFLFLNTAFDHRCHAPISRIGMIVCEKTQEGAIKSVTMVHINDHGDWTVEDREYSQWLGYWRSDGVSLT